MSIDWPRLVEIIRTHQRFLLTSHIRPDCDALGSELGLAGILESLGKQVRIVNGQGTPPNLAFIDPERKILVIDKDVKPEQLQDAEVLIVLDTSAWAQLGPMDRVVRQSKALKLIIDHHVSGDDLGAELFKDTTAEATGRLITEAAGHLGVRLTPEIATHLFAAVATDTGWFRFESTSGRTLRTAAELIDAGARPNRIYQDLYERDTIGRLRLVGRALARAEVEREGRLIHTTVFLEDFKEAGALPSDTEDVINSTLSVGGTQVAVILVEQTGGGFKISFRSRSAVDCSKLAEMFGGGGHRAAAGAFAPGSYSEARDKVLDAVRAAMK